MEKVVEKIVYQQAGPSYELEAALREIEELKARPTWTIERPESRQENKVDVCVCVTHKIYVTHTHTSFHVHVSKNTCVCMHTGRKNDHCMHIRII